MFLITNYAFFYTWYPASNADIESTMLKGPLQTTEPRTSIELANAVVVGEKHGTHGDQTDMDRMGKLQVLRVSSHDVFDNVFMYLHICSDNSNLRLFLAMVLSSAILGHTH
jgi:hypothetical protein